MNATEIRDAVLAGEMTVDEARVAFQEAHQGNVGQLERPRAEVGIVEQESRPRGIEHAPLSVPDLQVQDREALAEVRRDLALVVESTSTQHEYQRQMVEERFRHYTAMPIIALLGIADGALEGIGYSISEIAESFSYAVVRTGRRIKEGIERGARQ